MAYTDKLAKIMKIFDIIKQSAEGSDRTKLMLTCLQLMYKRMQQGFANKRLISCNREFLKLQKVLMFNQIPGKFEAKELESI